MITEKLTDGALVTPSRGFDWCAGSTRGSFDFLWTFLLWNVHNVKWIACNLLLGFAPHSRLNYLLTWGLWNPARKIFRTLNVLCVRPLCYTRSGVTLDLRTYVHLGRACRFTYAGRWSGIPRKSRHGLTYFTFRCWFDRAMPFAVRDG